ncbi:ATP-binding protein [Candidatus Woesearchaeota archaeon]|nr:ATP-binding protein [Candidatus Woesearchaeota archaeon]
MSYFIIIRGPLGSGKSTIAEKLAERIKAKYFSVDRILDEFGLTKFKEAGYVSQKSFIKANEIAAERAKKFLDKNVLVVFDGNFYWKSQIEDLIKRLEYLHFVFTLKVPLEVCIERDRKRSKTHGEDAVIAVYKKSTEFSYGNVIDANKSLDAVIEEIVSYLPKK